MTGWTLDTARETYSLLNWSNGYFDANDAGNLTVNPQRGETKTPVAITDIVDEAIKSGLSLPILIRFVDILHDRVNLLINAFNKTFENHGVSANFTAVYPIKVNQQRRVVEEIIKANDTQVGLEAGSKPELVAVLATAPDGSVIICNGYKDREYIRLALLGKRLGHRIYIVIEKQSELKFVLEESKSLNIRPTLGMRVRLASIGHGKWQNTGGDKSKFGLSAAQSLQLVERLKSEGYDDCLELLHFHLGSQIANVRDIQRGMSEIARYYAEMHNLGIKINVVDVGGGLAVDYEGTRSRSDCSMNYTIDEYAHNVVRPLWDICKTLDLPFPNLISESGRAMTAHHAVLVTDVIDVDPVAIAQSFDAPSSDSHSILMDLWNANQSLHQRAPLEIYHEVVHLLSEVHTMFTHGVLSLADRSWAEEVHLSTCHAIRQMLRIELKTHREAIDDLDQKMVDKYFCNFSLFQSMPDSWAIDQIFPVSPLTRLNEQPTRRAVIQDLTCDSDGHIESYVEFDGINHSMPLHDIKPNTPYMLGIFMVGAYQEILGDLHNLFGDTDAVNVSIKQDGSFALSQPVHGDTIEDVLRFVHFERGELSKQFKRKVAALNETPDTKRMLQKELEAGLSGSTYLEQEYI